VIALYRARGLLGRVIAWQTRGAYSHAAWVTPSGKTYEAHAGLGVVCSRTPWANNRGSEIDIYALPGLTDRERGRIENFLARQVGAKYDMVGVIRFLSGVNRNNWQRWFCSELVAEACEVAGRKLLNTEPWRISPATLAWSTEIELLCDGIREGAIDDLWAL
jgi:hypothetical protein